MVDGTIHDQQIVVICTIRLLNGIHT